MPPGPLAEVETTAGAETTAEAVAQEAEAAARAC